MVKEHSLTLMDTSILENGRMGKYNGQGTMIFDWRKVCRGMEEWSYVEWDKILQKRNHPIQEGEWEIYRTITPL